MRVQPSSAALLVIDVQERLVAAMPEAARLACERNIVILAEAARRLALPVVLSEQYPKGLGPTAAPVLSALAPLGAALTRVEKLAFACTGDPTFEAARQALARPTWIVVGMETHVCVYQTARGLVERGHQVHVAADAVLSRTQSNHDVGLRLCERADAFVTSTEALVFDLLERAGTDDFRALSRLMK